MKKNRMMNPNQKSTVTFIVNYVFSSKMRFRLMILLWQVNKMFLNYGRVTCWPWRYSLSVTAHFQQCLDWWCQFQSCREKDIRMGQRHGNSTTNLSFNRKTSGCSVLQHWHVSCQTCQNKEICELTSLCNLCVLMHVVNLEFYLIFIFIFIYFLFYYFLLFIFIYFFISILFNINRQFLSCLLPLLQNES